MNAKEINEITKQFVLGKAWSDEVEVEIVGGEQKMDTLTMLRIYEQEPTVDNELLLVSGFCNERVVRFTRKGEVLKEVLVKGSLGDAFDEVPYLLDILCKACYGLLLKKLTPPSIN